jgi:hypothetical protein
LGYETQEGGHLEDTGTDVQVLKWIIKKYNWRIEIGFIWSRIYISGRAVLIVVIHLYVP